MCTHFGQAQVKRRKPPLIAAQGAYEAGLERGLAALEFIAQITQAIVLPLRIIEGALTVVAPLLSVADLPRELLRADAHREPRAGVGPMLPSSSV